MSCYVDLIVVERRRMSGNEEIMIYGYMGRRRNGVYAIGRRGQMNSDRLTLTNSVSFSPSRHFQCLLLHFFPFFVDFLQHIPHDGVSGELCPYPPALIVCCAMIGEEGGVEVLLDYVGGFFDGMRGYSCGLS